MYLFQDGGEEKQKKTVCFFGCSNKMYDVNGNRTGFTFFLVFLVEKKFDEFRKVGCPERQERTGL